MNNPYEILGINTGASEAEVKNAYKKLVKEYSMSESTEDLSDAQVKQRMVELDRAFDEVIGNLRTGTSNSRAATDTTTGNYPEIRRLINDGKADEAITRLSSLPGATTDAEWNFLMGSAYYYKGWMSESIRYFEKATTLAPENREYKAAYARLKNSAGGNVAGNPYGGYNSNMSSCSCCDVCSMLMCADLCCGCGGC